MQPTFRLLCCGHNNNSRLRYHSLFYQRYTMALSNTAQPINTSLRKIAVVVATAVAGMSAYTHAAETPKKKKPSLSLPLRLHRKVHGASCYHRSKTIRDRDQNGHPIQKVPQSISVVTAEEMALHQPRSVKEALSYTRRCGRHPWCIKHL